MTTERPSKVLVVCHGNINRSPLCAAILKAHMPTLEVRSAGVKTKGEFGQRCSAKLRRYWTLRLEEQQALCNVMDPDPPPLYRVVTSVLENHLAKWIVPDEDIPWADKVIYMDSGNHRRLMDMWESNCGMPPLYEAPERLLSLGSIVGEDRVPDPGFMRAADPAVNEAFRLVERATLALVEQWT